MGVFPSFWRIETVMNERGREVSPSPVVAMEWNEGGGGVPGIEMAMSKRPCVEIKGEWFWCYKEEKPLLISLLPFYKYSN